MARPAANPTHSARRTLHKGARSSLNSAAEEIHVNPSYLSSLFTKELGRSFVSYLTDVRLKKAVRLLEDTDDSIQEIAFACGFREPNYFSRIFRKKYGLSPREYRAR